MEGAGGPDHLSKVKEVQLAKELVTIFEAGEYAVESAHNQWRVQWGALGA